MSYHRKPSITVDIFIYNENKDFILIKRKMILLKIVGHFQEALLIMVKLLKMLHREAKEETSIDVNLKNNLKLFRSFKRS